MQLIYCNNSLDDLIYQLNCLILCKFVEAIWYESIVIAGGFDFYLSNVFKMPFDIYAIESWIDDDDKRCNWVLLISFSVCVIFYCLLLVIKVNFGFFNKTENNFLAFSPSLTEWTFSQ